jgi:hypothetical protein
MVHHPIYAGAYAYGRRKIDLRRRVAGKRGSGRVWAANDEWQVLIYDRLPAYITWEQYEANQRKLRENCTLFGSGSPRGTALLAGRVACGRCGKPMGVSYVGRAKARFLCDRDRKHLGLHTCQSLAAQPLEELVTQLLLLALEPASLELSLQAAEAMEHDRRRLDQQHVQSVERAAYEADRAWRQYTAVEPENRLVARDLERRWEAALQSQKHATEELDRFRAAEPTYLSEGQRQRIKALAADIPALWSAESSEATDRQTILRTLIERIEVTVVNATEHVEVKVRWAGGYESRHTIRRPIPSYSRLEDGQRILDRVVELRGQGYSHREVAEQLNAGGYRAPRGEVFTGAMAGFLWRRARDAALISNRPGLPKGQRVPAERPPAPALRPTVFSVARPARLGRVYREERVLLLAKDAARSARRPQVLVRAARSQLTGPGTSVSPGPRTGAPINAGPAGAHVLQGGQGSGHGAAQAGACITGACIGGNMAPRRTGQQASQPSDATVTIAAAAKISIFFILAPPAGSRSGESHISPGNSTPRPARGKSVCGFFAPAEVFLLPSPWFSGYSI